MGGNYIMKSTTYLHVIEERAGTGVEGLEGLGWGGNGKNGERGVEVPQLWHCVALTNFSGA